MSQNSGYLEANIHCPFFRRESAKEHRITCEGPAEGMTHALYFSGESARQAHLRRSCCTPGYADCPVARCIAGPRYAEKRELEKTEADLLRLLHRISDGSLWYHTGEVAVRNACRAAAALLERKNRQLFLLRAENPPDRAARLEAERAQAEAEADRALQAMGLSGTAPAEAPEA